MYTHSLLNPATNMAAAIGRFAKTSFAAAKKARIGDIMGVSKVSAVFYRLSAAGQTATVWAV